MKKLLLVTFSLLSIVGISKAQNGLEDVIVERYYVSNANDATVNSSGGVLPVGSVTYRVYIDMLPDYVLQSVYGDPVHECRIETTTQFFNNEDRGAVHPTFNFNYCDDNTVMLDSWLSVGAACNGRYGILKSLDDTVANVQNSDGVLQNNDPMAGIPLTDRDGIMLTAIAPEAVITAGIANDVTIFDSQTNGSLFSTYNGAWASLNGSTGPDAAVNQVLIMQMTTDGVFSFCLNIQIRNQITFGVENYVATNAQGSEIAFPALCHISTGIEESSVSHVNMKLAPNPTQDVTSLTINASEKPAETSYIIYDVLGNKIAERDLGIISGLAHFDIDLSALTPGIYMLELNANGFKETKKIIRN